VPLWLVSPNAQELDSEIAGYCDAGKNAVRARTMKKVLGRDSQTFGIMAAHLQLLLHGMPATLSQRKSIPKRTSRHVQIQRPNIAAARLLRWAEAKKEKLPANLHDTSLGRRFLAVSG
jgi:hypothetical protein